MSFNLDTPPLFEREWLEERVRRFAVERKVAGFHWPGPATKYSLDTVEGVVALVLTGPEQIEALDFPLIHHEDDQRLAYSSGDRHLLRHYLQAEWMDRIAYTGIPLTPMDQLQQYATALGMPALNGPSPCGRLA